MPNQTNTPKLRLSVLDQAPVSAGSSGSQALRYSLDLAQLADRLGYHRYWVAEHHGAAGLACTSPEVLVGPIATVTSRIRVGSGGVMLPHYSPLKVAEQFSMLSGLYPGRIDLGIGRAAGTDPVTTTALRRDREHRMPDDFTQQLNELLAYLWNQMPADHPFARLTALPGLPEIPVPWMLGSSPQSGIWAAEMGLPYMFADFINPDGADVARRYCQRFVPSDTLATPSVGVAVQVICADTDEAAERISTSYRMRVVQMHTGHRLDAVPSIETALRFFADSGITSDIGHFGRRVIVGSAATVRQQIETVAAEYQADEVMIVSTIFEHGARRRSYELIADAFRLV
ncbi:LLM class flavin-dependent oxidoreductase [Paraherbaspirillum soli]|uniref:LLM class flavin-dependent oxidoreductase n=1 Tax=Paraherbaspirillum soli TaxID=631222 RepID=A0ABW0M6C3_9BURK